LPNSWFWEVKLDGYRALAVKSDAGVTLFSRRRKSLNRQFPYIVDALGSLPEGTVVDGELIAIDDKRRVPQPSLLRLRILTFRAPFERLTNP
jgi:ATP-dependent DNA ligase